ncbi:hypothetical protein ABN028_19970 [Actinopolymorpha sp. B17G11]|uniref:hypothetical protein n=1 Tax=Actinopolymorpha sp. B17G11 TaxID=3160861 RepID=UPI0032E3DAE6
MTPAQKFCLLVMNGRHPFKPKTTWVDRLTGRTVMRLQCDCGRERTTYFGAERQHKYGGDKTYGFSGIGGRVDEHTRAELAEAALLETVEALPYEAGPDAAPTPISKARRRRRSSSSSSKPKPQQARAKKAANDG